MRRFHASALVVGLIGSAATVYGDHPFEGRWYGQFELSDGREISTLINAEELEGGWVLRITQVQEDRLHQPIVSFEIDGRSVSVRPIVEGGTQRWNGELDADFKRYAGEVTTDGQRLGSFVLNRTPSAGEFESVQEWRGSFISPGRDYEQVKLVFGHDGERWHGDISLPVRTISSHPLEVSELGNGLLAICPLDPPITFRIVSPSSLLSEEVPGQLLASVEEQGNQSSLILNRNIGEPFRESFRPQTPTQPFPYQVEQSVLKHPIGHDLGVTFTRPKGEGPFPAAVLVSSLGESGRDHVKHGHEFQAVWADALARCGIASIRFDDRGTGQSTLPEGAPVAEASIRDQAKDLRFLVEYLTQQPVIDLDGIGIIGWGDGALAAISAAPSMYREVSFLVLLSSPGVPLGELLKWRMSDWIQSLPLDPVKKDKVLNSYATLIDVAGDSAATDEELRELVLRHQKALAEMTAVPGGISVTNASVEEGMRTFASPAFRENLRFRPAMMLPRVQCPVLAVSGSLDRQTPTSFSLPYIEAAVQRTGGEVDVVEISSLNNYLQPVDAEKPKDPNRIRATVDPRALRTVTDWINQIVGPVPDPASKP